MKTKLSHLILAMAFITVVAGAITTQNAYAARQTNMIDALESLKSARNSLNAAERDKGGHRAKAVSLVNQAIEEVKAGMADGATN